MATTTQGNRIPDISYAGSALASTTTYYWRIKFWDAANAEGAWSTVTSTFILPNIQYAQTFAYNKIGNMATSSMLGNYLYAGTNYANPHAPTSIGGVTLTYDNNGNVLTYGAKAYTWDYRNRITQAGTGSATSTYGYDYGGSRVTLADSTGTTKFANRLYSTNGATTTKHIFAGGTLIAVVEKIGNATTTHIIHLDHLGGTNKVTDKNGAVVQTLEYYPYGGVRTNTKTTNLDERRKFTGHQYDTSTALSYMGARYYDGVRGQFLSEDPAARDNPEQFLSDPQQLNAYSYARNNPLAYTDPNGEQIAFALEMALLTAASALLSGALLLSNNPYYQGWVNDSIRLASDIIRTVQNSMNPGSSGGSPGVQMIQSAVNFASGSSLTSGGTSNSQTAVSTPVTTRDITIPQTQGGSFRYPNVDFARRGDTRIDEKSGGFEQAKQDFWAKQPKNVQERPNGTITGQLENGDKVNVRPHSTDGRPTLEIQKPNGDIRKTRYNE